MFAPIGFTPFPELLGALDRLATAAWTYEFHSRYAGKAPPKGEGAAKAFMKIRELLAAWLLHRALDVYQVYAASPSGNIIVVSGMLLEHMDQLNWSDWEWPDADDYYGELLGPYDRAKDGSENPLSRFLFIDCWTGTISVDERMEEIRRWALKTGDHLIALANVARQIDKWAICFDNKDMPSSLAALASDLSFDLPLVDYAASDDQRPSRRGRPSKALPAAEIYKSEFPDGHGKMQREEVRKRVERLGKISISLDTLDKAIRIANGEIG